MVLRSIRDDTAPIDTLRNFAQDYIQPRLERVPGVAKINVFGGREEEMQVVFDEKAVAARKVNISEIAQALSAGNKNISAGNLNNAKNSTNFDH